MFQVAAISLVLGINFSVCAQTGPEASQNAREVQKKSAPQKIDGLFELKSKEANENLAFLRQQSEEDVIKILQDSYKKTTLASLLEKHPRLALFLARALRDEEALPALFKMATDRRRLVIFAAVNIAIIIFSFLWRRRIKRNSDLKFWGRWKKQLRRILLVKVAQLGFFIYYWNSELAPSWRIFRTTFF